LISDKELSVDYIIPDPFDKRVCESVTIQVMRVAREMGIARI